MKVPFGCLLAFAYSLGINSFNQLQAADTAPVEPAKVTVIATDPVASEAGPSTGLFTVSRSGPVTNPLSVAYKVGGTAISSGDYNPLPGIIVIPAGASSASVLVTPIDDNLAENDETVVLTVVSPAEMIFPVNVPVLNMNYVVGTSSSATVTIKDNDLGVVTLPTVQIKAADAKAAEPSKAGKITISRLGDAASPLKVEYTIVTDAIQKPNDSDASSIAGPIQLVPAATMGVDYQTLPGFVTIAAGEHSASVVIQPIDDTAVEGLEHVTLKLKPSALFNINLPDTASVFITDDDPVNIRPEISILTPKAGDSFTAPATILISAQATDKDGTVKSVEFFANSKSLGVVTASPYQFSWKDVSVGEYSLTAKVTDDRGATTTSAAVRIKVIKSTIPVVTMEAVEARVLESDPAKPGTIRVKRTGSTAAALEVHYSIGGTASNGVDYEKLAGVVTIPGGANSAPISIVPIPDKALEGNETVLLTLLALPTALNSPATYSLGNPSSATVTIVETLTGGTPLIPLGSPWRYLDKGTDEGTAWRTVTFDDSRWAAGPAQLGYGDGDEATVVSYGPDPKHKYITTYFRTSFKVTDPTTYSNLVFSLLRDDGAVVYLNGTEVFRSNMPDGVIQYQTLAVGSVVKAGESTYHTNIVDSKLLVAGVNVVAVEIHQRSVSSSDMSFDLELKANVESTVPTPGTKATLTIDNPKDGALILAGSDLTINATAIDPAGYITRVEFYANDKLIGVSQIAFLRAPDPGTPIHHLLEWAKVPLGKYILVAKAKDSSGAEVTSAPVTISAVVTATPRVAAPRFQNSGSTITFPGEAGTTYSIQTSSDLIHWEEAATVPCSNGQVEFNDSAAGQGGHRFYRAVPVDK